MLYCPAYLSDSSMRVVLLVLFCTHVKGFRFRKSEQLAYKAKTWQSQGQTQAVPKLKEMSSSPVLLLTSSVTLGHLFNLPVFGIII